MTTTEKVIDYLRDIDLARARSDDAGRAIGMGRFNMARALEAEGTTYGRLLDCERRRRCEILLAVNPRPDTVLIARKIGYTEPNSASRAFKRWFGMTLRQHKRELIQYGRV